MMWEIEIILRIAYTAVIHTKEHIEKSLNKITEWLERLDE